MLRPRRGADSTRTPPAVVPSTHHSETTINHQHHSPHGRAGSAARPDSLFYVLPSGHGVTRIAKRLMLRECIHAPRPHRAPTRDREI